MTTYVHCCSHVSVAGACKNVPTIRNLFDKVLAITWFISGSAKRKAIFQEVSGNSRTLVDRITEEATDNDIPIWE